MFYEHWSYLGVFAVLIFASLGMPIPEDVPLLTGGYLCFAGLANVYLMILVGFLGVLTGDFFLFTIGRKFGHHVFEHRLIRRLVNPTRLVLAERLFAKHGVKIIFVGRFLPGLRPMIFTAAGVLKVPPMTFLAVNGSAACLSVPLLVLLGRAFGQHLDVVKGGVRTVTHVVVVAVALAVVVAAGIYLHGKQKRLTTRLQMQSGADEKTLASLRAPDSFPADEDAEVLQPETDEAVA